MKSWLSSASEKPAMINGRISLIRAASQESLLNSGATGRGIRIHLSGCPFWVSCDRSACPCC
jgi:hypothetical protein